MIKLAKIVDEETIPPIIPPYMAIPPSLKLNISKGFSKIDVEEGYNGWYVSGHAAKEPEETTSQKLNRLESEYQLTRVIREIILSNPNNYSEFNVLRAKELEELAKELRNKKEVK